MSKIQPSRPREDEILEFPERQLLPSLQPKLGAFWAWLAHPLHFFLTLCSLIPPLLILLFTQQRAVNVPMWDEWAMDAPMAIDLKTGQFELADLFAQRNEHRLVFHKAVTVLFVLATDWNVKTEAYLNWATALLYWLVLAALFKKSEAKAFVFALVPLAFMLFAARQNLNWYHTAQLGWHLVVLFFVVALFSLVHWGGWQGLALAAGCGVCATFSTAQGLVVWFAIPLALWLLGYRQPRFFAAWIAAAVLSMGVFFWGFDFGVMGADEQGQSAGIVTNPVVLLRYLIAFLGSPFVPFDSKYGALATLIGISGLGLLAANSAYLWQTERGANRWGVWLTLPVFVGGVGLMTALGRAHIFPENSIQPLLDRYTLFGGVFWAALIALLLMALRRLWESLPRSPLENGLLYTNLLACVCLIGLYVIANYHTATLAPVITPEEQQCVKQFPFARNYFCLNRVFVKDTPLDDVLHRIDRLATLRLAIFADRDFPPLADIITLRDLEQNAIGEQVRTSIELYQLASGYQSYVLFQHPDSQVEYSLTLPQTSSRIEFRSAVWVDTQNLAATNIPERQDGALFRLKVRDVAGIEAVVYEEAINPYDEPVPLLAVVDLSSYNGQSVTLIFQTEKRNNPYYDWAMWMDPLIMVYSQ